ncbi:transmembrane signal receptor [Lithospermum erythrorhizon]|uniref:Transmembrane signal receptor n=1 Tax=Lithospermum erythrorhizon TaxID=34254 RepID=A0AAV3R9K4_LITER
MGVVGSASDNGNGAEVLELEMSKVRPFLVVAVVKNWELHQMNVDNVFLHGDLSEKVYMRIPPGFLRVDQGMYMICLFLGTISLYWLVLGVKVACNQEGIFLSQRKYVLDVISEAGLLGARPVHFPMEQNHCLGSSTSAPLQDVGRYRRLVGRLIYFLFIRPDLSFVVHVLSQFLHEPRQDHWTVVLRIVKYLKGSPGQGILFRTDCDLRITGWFDFDWAGCPLTRRSVSGWIVFFGNSPISYKTKEQAIVFRSSVEAKYMSMSTVTCELKWMLFWKGLFEPHVFLLMSNWQISSQSLGRKQFEFLLCKLGIHDLHAPT